MTAPGSRFGIGYDSHRLAQGGPLLLGGVVIPAEVHLVGHSDADVICHSITDAILGASGLGDIGEMFPETDARNKGRDSVEMLVLALERVRAEGWQLGNVDVVVVAQSVRIAPHRANIRARLATALGVQADAISVKGKTNEGMGWVGRDEGIACMAVAGLFKI